VSFTDLFGHLVGETLLGAEVKNSTLSGQRRCLDKGQMPMPLYTCVNVKKNVSARVFQVNLNLLGLINTNKSNEI